jgi:hypothetical protein
MADRTTIMSGVWDSILDQWRAGNIEAARSLERFLTALEALEADESADLAGDRRPSSSGAQLPAPGAGL